MQIDQIRLTELFKNEKAGDKEIVPSGTDTQKTTEKNLEGLRTILVESPFYDRESMQKETWAKRLEKDLATGTDANARMNRLAVYANTTSEQDLQKMQEEGCNPLNTEVETLVTVVDRIKLALAKGGADLSSMGGLSAEKIESMTGSATLANQIVADLKRADISVDIALEKEIETTVAKAEELQDDISADSVKYLLGNELEPTIDNVYQASFAAGSAEYGVKEQKEYAVSTEVSDEMQKQFAAVIKQAGLEETPSLLQDCQWMMENQVMVTADNLLYMQQLKEMKVEMPLQDLAQNIKDAVVEGKKPGEAVFVPAYSMMAQAREAYEKQQTELSMLTTTRQRDESWMLLSVQANYALLKKGIAIDTMGIEQVLQEIRGLEKEYLSVMLAAESAEKTEKNVAEYMEFSEQLNEVKTAPADILAHFSDMSQVSFSTLREAGLSAGERYREAERRYETLWTAPRRDMGDSIQKAFANVDDILKDLGMETTSGNQRAVRILAYNEMELSEENIQMVKTADEKVQRMFRALKPDVVMKMIKEGNNPLDKTVGELTQTAENLAQENGAGQEETFSKFLWKLEQTGDISLQERDSYVGLYRMIHQVEKGEGAAIGALLAQGTQVTLRNLMTAVRSRKQTGRDYQIDDDFGTLEGFDRKILSITQQAEMAFQTACLKEAGMEMTPVKMKQFDGEDSYMEMSPEQFRDSLVSMTEESVAQEEAAQEKEYAKWVQEQVKTALTSEAQVYEILERNDIPTTPTFLNGVMEMLKNKNSVYRKLLKYANEEKEKTPEIEQLITDLLEDYAESVKTPEEMAKAQRKLEETAENVMKNMLVEKDVSSIDVRGMKLVTTQIQTIGKIAKKSETYHIPIMVEDQVGNLSLKIVRGSEKKGLVEVAMDTEITGVVRGSFRYEAGEIAAEVSFAKREVQEIFSQNTQQIAEDMREATGLPTSFRFAWDTKADASDFYQEKDPGFEVTREQDDVSTRVLYGVARSFIQSVSEII